MSDFLTTKDAKSELGCLINAIKEIASVIKLNDKQARIVEIDGTLAKGTTWNEETNKLVKEKSFLERDIENIVTCQLRLQNIQELVDIINNNDEALLEEIKVMLKQEKEVISQLEIESFFATEEDKMPCLIEISAGAGGTDSQDLASMLVRMYLMWGNKNGYNAKVLDTSIGEEAGIKHSTIQVEGNFAFGKMKHETGVHRFVRLSPFNANDKRQTSFVSVFVYPLINDSINESSITLEEKDLKIEACRSSGAGGQHVNKTDSAVRITHIPSGITVKCQSERSQMQNKAMAMKILKSKLREIRVKEKTQEKEAVEALKSDISWGNQIRNYILHPYKLVKDLRSGYETGDVNGVLNGNLDEIINSLIKNYPSL